MKPTAETHARLEVPGYARDRLLFARGPLALLLGRRIADEQPVLIKIAVDEDQGSATARLLETEFALMRKLAGCEGVAEAIEFLQGEGAALILRDSLRSLDPVEWLTEHRPDMITRMNAAIQLATGLAAIHERGILHHNLNPASIRLDAGGKAARIHGFDLAVVQAGDRSTAVPDNWRLTGDLGYISPERTGRINRGSDARSDLYSLGAVLYYFFTQQAPFESVNDPLQLVHAHVARDPIAPHTLDTAVPESLSQSILKLLAKNPEDRYENATALASDLKDIRDRMQSPSFPQSPRADARSYATPGRFQISKRLYGRDSEISGLTRDFQEHLGVAKRFLLVAGTSGIGKSALVTSLIEPVRRARGFFAAGKYDTLRRDVPYDAVAQAVRDWIEQMLTESPAELKVWRESLIEAVGANGQTIADVIPEIEYLIGPSVPAQPLAPAEQRDRFNLTFRNFARIFTKHERPLILFLDDLQWADLASLELLELLLADDESRFIYVIGAYRENEVEPADPLSTSLSNIKKSAKNLVRKIPLGPLPFESIAEMIADSFEGCSQESPRLHELAQVIQNYTGGNPFFIVETLKTLYQENLVRINDGHWQWDLEQIKNRSVSNDIAMMMADRLGRLPDETRKLVLTASCIGDVFNLQLLARLNGTAPDRTEAILDPASVEGFVVRRKSLRRDTLLARSETFAFVHDRVQQAAYEMLNPEERRVIHRDPGLLLLGDAEARRIESLSPETVDAFSVAHHLNLGLSPETGESERVDLAWLNLAAGKRARGSTAYRVSLKYFKQAADLLPREAWRKHHDLAIDLHRQWSECEYLSGNFERAERLFSITLRNARRKEDRADIYTFRIVQYTNQGRYRLALRTLHAALRIFDVRVSLSPSKLSLHWNILRTHRRLALLSDADLLNREDTHPVRDPEIEACIRLLMSGMAPAYELAEQRLFSVLSMHALQLSLRHGFTAESSFALACYGMTLSRWLGRYDLAMRYGRLALEMSARKNHMNILCRNQFLLGAFIAPWREALGEHTHLRQGHKLGRESGNVIYGGYCLVFLAWHRFFKGENLATLCAKLAMYERFFRNTRDYSAEATTGIVSRLSLNLQGLSDDPTAILGDGFEADYFFEHIWVFGLSSYYLSAMIQAYMREDFAQTLEMAAHGEKHLSGAMVAILQPEHYFYHSLALAAVYKDADRRDQKRIAGLLKSHSSLFRAWTRNCPANFEPRFLLIEAERARLAGDESGAMRLYEKAIHSAQKFAYPHIEALACDLSARFYRDWNFPTLAAAQADRARRLYSDWGATGRLKRLNQALP